MKTIKAELSYQINITHGKLNEQKEILCNIHRPADLMLFNSIDIDIIISLFVYGNINHPDLEK